MVGRHNRVVEGGYAAALNPAQPFVSFRTCGGEVIRRKGDTSVDVPVLFGSESSWEDEEEVPDIWTRLNRDSENCASK